MASAQSNNITLNGLVLAGGKSTRMGQDKGLLQWYDKPHRYYVADMLSDLCEQVFISCRVDQVAEIEQAGYNTLPDRDNEISGQFYAIKNALETSKDTAWLVMACDVPLVTNEDLQKLTQVRDLSKMATAYKDENNLPEPLIAIWEPSSLMALKEAEKQGISCPRKTLIRNTDKVKLVSPRKQTTIINSNTPEDAEFIRKIIKGSHENKTNV